MSTRPLLGICGGGQLGRMLALAGAKLGVRCRVVDPTADATAGEVAELVTADWGSDEARAALAACDVVTYEFENVPDEALAGLPPERVRPTAEALRVSRDRLFEKRFFRELGLSTTRFAHIDSFEELVDAGRRFQLPALLKTRRFGYDGKGQRLLRSEADLAAAWSELSNTPLLLEAFAPFRRELSVVAVRASDGKFRSYPLVENVHRDGILHLTWAPAAGVSDVVQERASEMARQVAEALGYVGVLTIELFEMVDGTLLVNEMAPRVHNSGHWTLEGAETSQFENHVRAVLGWPIGSTRAHGPAAMLNLVGELPDPADILMIPGAHLHQYGKEPRPGRKVGHVTFVAHRPEELSPRLAAAREALRSARYGD